MAGQDPSPPRYLVVLCDLRKLSFNFPLGDAWGHGETRLSCRLWHLDCTLAWSQKLAWGLWFMTERRTARRYDLSLPVVVRIPVGEKAPSQQGKTRDVSTRGVYLLLDRTVSRDSEFDLTMVLPTEATGSAGVFVRAVGKVVRVEEWTEDGNSRVGVGAMLRRYEIVRNESLAR